MKPYAIACLLMILLLFAGSVNAASDYTITSFESIIELQENADLLVTEKIKVDFNIPKHGIFRIVPVTYSAGGRTINADFDLLSIKDEIGKGIEFKESKFGRSVEMKIGDPDTTLVGEQVYVVNYKLSDIVQQFDDHYEVYWNVTGSEWDTDIQNASVEFTSDYASIKDTLCYAGAVGTTQRNCKLSKNENSVTSSSTQMLGSGKDFTLVITLDKNSQIVFPSGTDRLIKTLKDNWDYILSVLPLILMILIWFKKGRDRRYLGDNVFYEPDDKKTKDRSPFAREHIPLIYHPIDNLTPAEVGTIVDEKVDIEDVVAEIVELSRLGYMDLVRVVSGGWFSKDTYALVKKEKDEKSLRDYQKLLLSDIFSPSLISDSEKKGEKIFEKKGEKDREIKKLLDGKTYVFNTSLEEKFYKSLPKFKEKLYEGLSERGYFDGNPDKTRKKWVGLFIALVVISIMTRTIFLSATGNAGPMVVTLLTAVPGIFIAYYMPRKTAKGYMFARQGEGLRFYLRKGEWRYEIEEKKLFLEEMLPLAVSLGVVGKLTKDMGRLGVKPPDYTYGFTTSAFSSNFRSFESGVGRSMTSSPKGTYSGSGSWSGGSGFSGGSSGGGFGGGGGGSW